MAVVPEGQDRASQIGGIEQLVAHRLVVAARLPPALGIRIRAHEPVRVWKPILNRQGHVARTAAVGHVLPPPARQVLDQLGVAVPSVVDVAVDDRSGIHASTWSPLCQATGRTKARPAIVALS